MPGLLASPPDINTSLTYGAYDDHTQTHPDVTVPQLTLLIVWAASGLAFLLRYPFRKSKQTPRNHVTSVDDVENQTNQKDKIANGTIDNIGNEIQSDPPEKVVDGSREKDDSAETVCTRSPPKIATNEGSVPPIPSLDNILQHTVSLGGIMLYFFYCDYKKMVPAGERVYTEDTFLFLVFILFLVSCFFTVKPTPDKVLNRNQTEEWKGWMQVMFVWYHYFNAKAWYNWIRVYIAAYVWMTGFGNFSFFWIRKDFSIWRVFKMLFRLNFFVILVCSTVKNEYMLYYICAMHTYWFVTVYVFMGVLSSWNTCRWRMALKFIAYAVFNAILFEVPEVHGTVFRPFRFVLGFTERNHEAMHEWAYRSGLDHWACFIGMLCAYNYPNFEAFLKYLEEKDSSWKSKTFKYFVTVTTVLLLGCAFVAWHQFCLPLPKLTYNRVHPYTSWIPIVIFIVLRNLHPLMRKCYVHMFAWLGKITLEAYLSQLHVYLQSNAKERLVYLPGYPLLNFCLATIIYLVISYKVFNLTTEFSAWILPKDCRQMAKRIAATVLVFATASALAFALKVPGLW